MVQPSGMRPWLAFATCGAIWGSTFLVISLGNEALAPVWAAALRLSAATILLTAWAFARGETLPRGAALHAALAYGACQFGINFPLLYWGEKMVPSGVTAVLFATIPLSSAFLTRAFGMERPSAAKTVGALVAFLGVAILFSSSLRGEIALKGLLAIVVAATFGGLAVVLLKRGPRQSPVGANAVGCAIGAVMTLGISFGMGEPHVLPTTAPALLPLVYLTLAGSLGAFVLMSWLVNHWPVTRASYVSVVVPVVALVLGTFVRHEPVTPSRLLGSAVVLVGLLVGMRGGSGPVPSSNKPQS